MRSVRGSNATIYFFFFECTNNETWFTEPTSRNFSCIASRLCDSMPMCNFCPLSRRSFWSMCYVKCGFYACKKKSFVLTVVQVHAITVAWNILRNHVSLFAWAKWYGSCNVTGLLQYWMTALECLVIAQVSVPHKMALIFLLRHV